MRSGALTAASKSRVGMVGTCEELQRVRGAKAKIAVDGGRELIGRRVLGYPSDWVEASVYDPPEDPAEAAGDS